MVQATSLPNLSVSKHMMHALRSDPGHSIASDLIPGGRSGCAVACASFARVSLPTSKQKRDAKSRAQAKRKQKLQMLQPREAEGKRNGSRVLCLLLSSVPRTIRIGLIHTRDGAAPQDITCTHERRNVGGE